MRFRVDEGFLVQKLLQEYSFREIEKKIVDCIRRTGVEKDSLETQIPRYSRKMLKTDAIIVNNINSLFKNFLTKINF